MTTISASLGDAIEFPGGVILSYTDITPSLAEEYLTFNTANRPCSEDRVKNYASDMRDNEWMQDGSPIRFGTSGKLIDGQNRLKAIVRSGKTIRTLVVRGLADSVFLTMDSGKARSAADGICIATGEPKYRTQVAAAARLAMNYQAGYRPGSTGFKERHKTAYVMDNPEIVERVIRAACCSKSIPISALAAVLFLASNGTKDLTKLDEFIEGVRRSDDLEAGDPRQELVRWVQRGRAATGKVPTENIFKACIYAWNDFLADRRASFSKMNWVEATTPRIRPLDDVTHVKPKIKRSVPSLKVVSVAA